MRIVLPGALPDPHEARELLAHLQKAAPALIKWLERAHATRIVADPAQTYCTAWEYWRILQHNFTPAQGQVYAAGLAPLLLDVTELASGTPVWLLELTHVSPSRDGAVLIPANDLSLTPEQSEALFRSAQPLFTDTGFHLHSGSTTHWRVDLPSGYAPACASPQLVSTSTVNDWWEQDAAGRPWRRLANELQMLWFDHPINQARYEQGQVPVNNLWLFGGACTRQFSRMPDTRTDDAHHDKRLLGPMLTKDWGRWLQVMHELDTELSTRLNNESEVILIGHDQIITLVTEKKFWLRWQPRLRDSWKKWWSPLS